MEWTHANLTSATEAVSELLGRLGLQRYLFAVEPRGSGCEVRVEYAATEGWKATTLHVDDATLLASHRDSNVQNTLSRKWRASLKHALYKSDVTEARAAEAIALGRAWAEEKADALRSRVPVAEWPDFWDDAEHGPLPLELTLTERREMQVAANRAARERWLELIQDQRSAESFEA
jgi:hypothetical protein